MVQRVIAVLSTLTVLGGQASAGQCPSLDGAAPVVGEQAAPERVAYIRDSMDGAVPRAWMWAGGWSAGFATASVAQAALIPLSRTSEERRMLYVSVGGTVSGLGLVVISPPAVIRNRNKLARAMEESSTDPCEVLRRAETLMVATSKAERLNQAWIMHGGNLAFNVGSGLILGLGWEQWDAAFLTVSVGTLVGEIMIWTQPNAMTKALQRYQTGAWVAPPRHAMTLRLHPVFFEHTGGIGASGTF